MLDAGRAAEVRTHLMMGSSPSHQQGQTECGVAADLILQPWRGQGKEAVSQQGSLGSRAGHGGLNSRPWFLVSLSWAQEPAHTLVLLQAGHRDFSKGDAELAQGPLAIPWGAVGREGLQGWFVSL